MEITWMRFHLANGGHLNAVGCDDPHQVYEADGRKRIARWEDFSKQGNFVGNYIMLLRTPLTNDLQSWLYCNMILSVIVQCFNSKAKQLIEDFLDELTKKILFERYQMTMESCNLHPDLSRRSKPRQWDRNQCWWGNGSGWEGKRWGESGDEKLYFPVHC